MKLRRFAVVVLAGMLATTVSVAQPRNAGRVDPRITSQVTARFKRMKENEGMLGVNGDVRRCYAGAKRQVDATRLCMLYDIAQVRYDRVVAKTFRSMGWENPSIDNEYLSDRAFGLRMKTYSGVAFGGSREAAFRFFDAAPDKIVSALSE